MFKDFRNIACSILFLCLSFKAFSNTTVEKINISKQGGSVCITFNDDNNSQRMKCWGRNKARILQNASTANISFPKMLPFFGFVQSFSFSENLACSILEDGALECWGEDFNGQFGNGSEGGQINYLPVSPFGHLNNITSVDVGETTICSIRNPNNDLYCWGSNEYGQQGHADGSQYYPRGIFSGIAQVAVSRNFICILSQTTGAALCSGQNDKGQLGRGSTSPQENAFQNINSLGTSLFKVVVGKNHACSLKQNGTVWCWGDNSRRQLGTNTVAFSSTPLEILNFNSVSDIFAGGNSTCAIKTDGTVWCWGDNSRGKLGVSSNSNFVSSPQEVATLVTQAKTMQVGERESCIVLTNEEVWCSGDNTYGQLGDGTFSSSNVPVKAAIESSSETVIENIISGWNSTCVGYQNDIFRCWGWNISYLINNLVTSFSSLEPVVNTDIPLSYLKFDSGFNHSCLLDQNNEFACWGQNLRGELGFGDLVSRSDLEYLISISNVVDFSVGSALTCAINAVGELYCWGWNQFGALGVGDLVDRTLPTKVNNLPAVKHVDSAKYGNHTCAITVDDDVYCWGYNGEGQIGTPDSDINNPTPIKMSSLDGAVDLQLGQTASCALMLDETVKCWGWNVDGQLGIGDFTSRYIPVRAKHLRKVKELQTGAFHLCALGEDRGLRCWGRNDNGQIGNGTFEDQPTAQLVMTDVKEFTVGAYHTCASKMNGDFYCWGESDNFGLGIDSNEDINTPTLIFVK